MDPSTSAFSTPVYSIGGDDRESPFPTPPTHPFLQDACCTDAKCTLPQSTLLARTTHPSLSCNLRKLANMYVSTISPSATVLGGTREGEKTTPTSNSADTLKQTDT